MASSFDLKLRCVPCMKSADDCQPISGFSHLCPLPSTSQSIRQWWPCQSPDCVAGLAGRYMLECCVSYVRSRLVEMPYRTVLAWSSIGAPERTAAGRTSPSSLPFMTRLGTGVKVLCRVRIELIKRGNGH